MAHQTSFLEPIPEPTPIQLGRRGERQAIDAAPDEWKRLALEALHQVCLDNPTFLIDAIWRVLDARKVHCPERRAIAGILSEGEKRGWCQRSTELRRSEQKQCHGNLRSIWISLIAEGDDRRGKELA